MQKNTLVRTSIAAGIAGLGLSLGGIALATADDDTPAPQSAAVTGSQLPPGPGHGPGRDDQLAADLADALDLPESKVADALDALHDELAPDAPVAGEPPTPPTEEELAARHEAFATALADELGLSVGEVTAALEELHAAHEAEARSALADRLDEAVSSGDLTEADKASVLKAFDAGVLGGPGPGPGFGPGH